jgi:hypothetical protein
MRIRLVGSTASSCYHYVALLSPGLPLAHVSRRYRLFVLSTSGNPLSPATSGARALPPLYLPQYTPRNLFEWKYVEQFFPCIPGDAGGGQELRGFSRELRLGWRRSEGYEAMCVSEPLGGVCRR